MKILYLFYLRNDKKELYRHIIDTLFFLWFVIKY